MPNKNDAEKLESLQAAKRNSVPMLLAVIVVLIAIPFFVASIILQISSLTWAALFIIVIVFLLLSIRSIRINREIKEIETRLRKK